MTNHFYHANSNKTKNGILNRAMKKYGWTFIKKKIDTNKFVFIKDKDWIIQSIPRNST
jgi:hypothetical protein